MSDDDMIAHLLTHCTKLLNERNLARRDYLRALEDAELVVLRQISDLKDEDKPDSEILPLTWVTRKLREMQEKAKERYLAQEPGVNLVPGKPGEVSSD